MPTLTQLRYLLVVHQEGHFSKGARKLNVSQPTLSAQIQKVESELGMTIFDRRARPVVATELGAEILEHAQAVVDAHDQLLRRAAGRFQGPSGDFALGIIPTLAPYVLPWFLKRFATAHPAVALSIHERPTDELLAEIGRRSLDAAILATPLKEPSTRERVLFYDPFYLYAEKTEAVLEQAEIEVAELDPLKLWLLEDGHCVRSQVMSFCGVHERAHLGSVQFAAGSFETLRHLIDASEGYTLVPETYARTLPRATRLRCVRAFETQTPTREVSLIHHDASYKSDVLDAIEDAISKTIPRSFPRAPDSAKVLPVRADSIG